MTSDHARMIDATDRCCRETRELLDRIREQADTDSRQQNLSARCIDQSHAALASVGDGHRFRPPDSCMADPLHHEMLAMSLSHRILLRGLVTALKRERHTMSTLRREARRLREIARRVKPLHATPPQDIGAAEKCVRTIFD
jgi:hypothetical protein